MLFVTRCSAWSEQRAHEAELLSGGETAPSGARFFRRARGGAVLHFLANDTALTYRVFWMAACNHAILFSLIKNVMEDLSLVPMPLPEEKSFARHGDIHTALVDLHVNHPPSAGLVTASSYLGTAWATEFFQAPQPTPF